MALTRYVGQLPDNLMARKLLIASQLKLGHSSDAVALLADGLKSAPQDAQMLALAGEVHMQLRDYDKAAGYFEKASQLEPKQAGLRTALATTKLARGDSAGAINELELSAKLDTSSNRAGIILTLTEMRLRHYDKALAAIEGVDKAHPKDPLVHNLKGGVLLGKGDVPKARASFQQAMTLNPAYFPAVANLAQLAIHEKKPAEARALFEGLLKHDKKNIEAMTALANLAANEGKRAETLKWLEKAQEENPNAPGPAIQLALRYIQFGEKQKALTLARKVQVVNPSDTSLLDLLGRTQVANGDHAGALDTYARLVGLAPKSAEAHMRLAGVQMLMKNESSALDTLKKANAMQPDFVQGHVAQAELLVRARKTDEAVAVARALQKARPKDAVGHVLEGDLQMSLKQPALAVAAYERGLALQKSPALTIKVGDALKAAGRETEANARLAKWQKDNPADTMVKVRVAEGMIQARKHQPAIKLLESVLAQEPKNVVALNNLAWLYQQEKDARALATAEAAFNIAGESPAIIDTLGWILIEQGNTARGVQLMEKALAINPNAPELRYHLAVGLAKAGDKARARTELKLALDAKQGFPSIEEARSFYSKL
ncbi:XrtA/PEP-CTERM system TPR-repeat protein PrsT [Massilia cavernae]|uniref:XrtA/PEP-CTERM system TPR-repeat protein PrsT n=1 Tax=Massilia cavernae TaxID=2320864 RepID=UPI0027D82A24|nr:XrtA/PEP-CTERM system TPR-repeat protein PrsT [Massilia cavernae]